jgi:hypothetical protein
MPKNSIRAICAACLLLSATFAYAEGDAGVCSTASLTNPNVMDGGMGGTGNSGGAGGTGIVAKGGAGGTGMVAEGGAGGTGISGGTGGTGVVASGGAGGTGMVAEGGAGGTGITGGAGGTGIFAQNALLPDYAEGGIAIVGVVTGFASICVDGVEVHYDAKTPLFDNGQATQLSGLAVGQMVMLKADRVNNRLQARAIGMIDAVAGPIDRLDIKRLQMEVMGQTVQLDQMTMQQMRALDANATVRVSGHRLSSGEIAATRVAVTGRANSVRTMGIVTSIADDGFVVNGTKVSMNSKDMQGKIKVGSEVQVGGAWNGNAIKANRVEAQPIKNMLNRADSAIMEGFAKLEGPNSLTLAGTEVVLSQVKTSYKNITNLHGKVVKMEIRRDSKGNWVCDNVNERKGKLFDRHGHLKNASGGEGKDDSGSDLSNSGKGSSGSADSDSSNSGSGSSDSGSSGSGHDSSDNLNSDSSGSSGSSGSSRSSGISGGSGSSGGSGASRPSGGGSSGGSSGGSGRPSGGGSSGGGGSGGGGGGGSSGGKGK